MSDNKKADSKKVSPVYEGELKRAVMDFPVDELQLILKEIGIRDEDESLSWNIKSYLYEQVGLPEPLKRSEYQVTAKRNYRSRTNK